MNLAQPFYFKGRIPFSKSFVNRQLVIDSYLEQTDFVNRWPEELRFSEDSEFLRKALWDWFKGKNSFYCGEGGTTLRFLVLRLSREKGNWIIRGHPRLFSRPHAALNLVLEQLGVSLDFQKDCCVLKSSGWDFNNKTPVIVDTSYSSQFLSSVILNSWNLEKDLELCWTQNPVSWGYFDLSKKIVQARGLQVQNKNLSISVGNKQKPNSKVMNIEADMSSAFAVAALAAVSGTAVLEDLGWVHSWQPDRVFIEILKNMEVPVTHYENTVEISQARAFRPVDLCLKESPDLFPVLAALCSLASGTSYLRNAPHLVYKESNRIERIKELLARCGRKLSVEGQIILIEGAPLTLRPEPFIFEAGEDHRLVMASAVLRWAGFPVEIRGVNSLRKSFSDFIDIAALRN